MGRWYSRVIVDAQQLCHEISWSLLPYGNNPHLAWVWHHQELYFSHQVVRCSLSHSYKVLQGASHRRRRGSAFSVRVVKCWNRLPASVVTAPSVNVSKKRLEQVWTEVFPHLPHWLTTHLPISTLPLHPTYTPPIISYHLYMLPNSLFYICGFFRPVLAYFLPLLIIIIIIIKLSLCYISYGR